MRHDKIAFGDTVKTGIMASVATRTNLSDMNQLAETTH